MKKVFEFEFFGKKLVIETGEIAKQADGAVLVRFDDTVVIQTKLIKYNGIKMEVEYIMTDKETGELRTTARSSHCFLNRAGKPISLKRSYPELDTKFFEFRED